MMVDTFSKSKSLKDYLKKYTSSNDEEKKKKKRIRTKKPAPEGVLIVDEDPVWQKQLEEDEDEDVADEEKPQVDEDIDVKRMRRLELLRIRRPYGAISEDGSGWISVSENHKSDKTDNQNSDFSPSERRPRKDSPLREPEQEPFISASDIDLSPPRKPPKHSQNSTRETENKYLPVGRRARYDSLSPERRAENSGSKRISDLSPPRRQQRNKFVSSPEMERKSTHNAVIDSDISPPRRARPESKFQDGSRTFSERDLSPPRKSKNIRTDSFSASRSKHDSSGNAVDLAATASDLSPPRKKLKEPSKMNDRKRSGLVSAMDIKEENARTKKEDMLRFKEMDPSASGRNAEAVYRNKMTGVSMSKEEFLKSKNEKEKPKEIKLEWGKGLAQKREAEAKFEELEVEKNKPFARGRDDPDLDRMLKERVRWGDPMAHLVARKQQSQPFLPDLGDNENMKESGFIIPQDIPSHSWIRRGLDFAPNRYGIKPGRHWDSVDRSNGYEKEFFKRSNEKRASDQEAYLWSVSDM